MRLPALLPRVLAASLALGACDGPTTPAAPIAGTYVLAQVAGVPAPLVIADHTLPSGTRQVYTLLYDTLHFPTDTAGRRVFELSVESFQGAARITPPLRTRFDYRTRIARRGDRVVLAYESATATALSPDTFRLRGDGLVRLGSVGVVCGGCPAPRRVEFVYEGR